MQRLTKELDAARATLATAAAEEEAALQVKYAARTKRLTAEIEEEMVDQCVAEAAAAKADFVSDMEAAAAAPAVTASEVQAAPAAAPSAAPAATSEIDRQIAADAAAAVLRDNCAGSFIVELDSEPSEHPSSWSHLKGFRRMGAALCGNQPVS